MNFSDNFFRRVEKKTNVDKGTIIDLAKKLQETDLKNGAKVAVSVDSGKFTASEYYDEIKILLQGESFCHGIANDIVKLYPNSELYRIHRCDRSDHCICDPVLL